MSASPTNAGLNLDGDSTPSRPAAVPAVAAESPRHEAFQALLAFSSLHEQIRQRQNGQSGSEDVWELEQFMLDEVLQLVAERALAITGADGVAIALADSDDIICRAAAGEIAPDAGARLDPNSGFSGACFRKGGIIRCDDTEDDPRVNVHAARRLGARSMVAVPLAGQETILGLLEAFSYDAYAFNDSDVRSLKLLAELILAALKPEEEDRLAQISRSVVARTMAAVEPVTVSVSAIRFAAEPAGEIRGIEPTGPISIPDELPEYETVESSRPGLVVVLAVLLVASALGAGIWWKIAHNPQRVNASSPRTTSVPGPTPLAVSNPSILTPEEETVPESEAQEKSGVLPHVTGVRHWSSADSSTVVVDLQDQVQYEAHRLSNPERIYIDLHDTQMVPGLSGKVIEVGDELLVRVRVAQPMAGVTRVVLDTKGGSNFSVSLEPNPYRLVVEVRGIGVAAQPRAKLDLFAPAAPPASAPATASKSKDVLDVRAGLPQFRIVLDAGHGGWDLGTVGRQGLLEKDLVLDVVERLGRLVQSRMGAEVIYTRQDDDYIALERRAEIANQAQADLFLSVHANYSDSASARGVETYYTHTYSSVHARSRGSLQTVDFARVDIREKVQESHRFAASVQRALYGTLAAKNSGIRDRGVKEASYVVLTGTSMPAILTEISFVSSPTDEQNLQSSLYRQQIAEALYKGLARYTAEPRKVKIASASGRPGGR